MTTTTRSNHSVDSPPPIAPAADAPILDFNFVAAHPPEACAARLKALAERHSSRTVRTQVSVRRFSNGNLHFKIQRSLYSLPTYRRYRGYQGRTVKRSNYIKLQVEGYLTSWADSGSTLVTGKAEILPKTYLINGIALLGFALVSAFFTVLLLADFLCFTPIILLLLVSYAHTTLIQPEVLGEKHKRQLIRQLIRALQHKPRSPKPDLSTTMPPLESLL